MSNSLVPVDILKAIFDELVISEYTKGAEKKNSALDVPFAWSPCLQVMAHDL